MPPVGGLQLSRRPAIEGVPGESHASRSVSGPPPSARFSPLGETMANASFGIFALFVWVGLTIRSVYSAWLHWTGSPRAPRSVTRSGRSEVARGHERGAVPLAAFFVLLTAGIFAIRLGAGPATAVVLLGAGIFFLALHWTIVWFNWPKFLVPRARRDEVGTITESLRHRRDLRAALAEAAERRSDPHSSDL